MAPATQANVDYALKRAGNFRVEEAQRIGFEGPADLISGALLLAQSCRETWLRNVVGGGHYGSDGRWVNTGEDRGAFQISEKYHADFLKSVAGCKSDTWVVVPGHNAFERGYVPQFSTGCRYAVSVLRYGLAVAEDRGVPRERQTHFAVAAYNCGTTSAWNGYRYHGNPDYYTTGGDYGQWVLNCRTLVNKFLSAHPNWRVDPPKET